MVGRIERNNRTGRDDKNIISIMVSDPLSKSFWLLFGIDYPVGGENDKGIEVFRTLLLRRQHDAQCDGVGVR
jgi:hypothetical protein